MSMKKYVNDTLLNYEKIEFALEQHSVKLLTIDIFDTLLLRNGKPEKERFYEYCIHLAKVLKIKKLKAIDLFVARSEAAQLAYKITNHVDGSREATLDEIHQIFCKILTTQGLSLDKNTTQIEEIKFEAKSLMINLDLVALIKKRLNVSDLKVLIVTDMYMSSDNIKCLFKEIDTDFADFMQQFDVWSSADHKYTKTNGRLFEKILKEYKLGPLNVLHIGDNDSGEISSCKKMGILSKCREISSEVIRALDARETEFFEEIGI